MNDLKFVDSDDMLMEQVEQARRMTPEQKFRAGGQLFDAACRFALAGIRGSFPGASEEECLARLKRRFALVDEIYPGVRP